MKDYYPEAKISITPYGSKYAYNFEDALDIPLDYPYSREEWDIIFAKYIELLNHKEYWLRLAAIARFKRALEYEQTQLSDSQEYKPRKLKERIDKIFQSMTPLIVEDLYNEFKNIEPLEEEYQHLIEQLEHELNKKTSQNDNYLQKIETHDFKIAVSHINGYLYGISNLCHGANYVPIYQAIFCPNIYNQMTSNIETGLLRYYRNSRFSANRLKFNCQCSNFNSVLDWENIWDSVLDRWIVNHTSFGDTYQVNKNKDLFDFRRFKRSLIYLIEKAFNYHTPIVWSFIVGDGYSSTIGFNNECYAFKVKNKLFVLTFGWID